MYSDLLSYLTTYSFALAVASKLVPLPAAALEYIRALVFVVFAAVVYIYAKYGTPALRSFYGNLFKTPVPPEYLWLILVIDLCVHILVLLWIGFPSAPWALIAAYATFIGWYALVRNRIQDLYIKEIQRVEYDFLAFAVVPMILVLYIIIKK